MASGFWQGAADVSGKALDTTFKYQAMQERQAQNDEINARANATMQMQQKQFADQQKIQAEKQAELSRPTNIKTKLPFLKIKDDDGRSMLIKRAQQFGADEYGNMTEGNYRKFMGSIESDENDLKTFAGFRIRDLESRIESASSKMSSAEIADNKDAYKKAQAEFELLSNKYTAATGGLAKQIESIRAKQLEIGAYEQKKVIDQKYSGTEQPKNVMELTRAALAGDVASKLILNQMNSDAVALARSKGQAASEGKIAGLQQFMDMKGTAKLILEGREVLENVKNTFGVPIQEAVRKAVLAEDPNFNFNKPGAVYNSLKTSLSQQQKNRGSMGSFVQNINGQVDKVDKISRDIISRVGVKALDYPMREINMKFVGSGHENVLDAYMTEISAEISKLSQGATASVAQLSDTQQENWKKIHDPSLSLKELIKVLNATREMANIRLKSVDDEIDRTIDKLGNVRQRVKATQIDPSEMSDDDILKALNE